MTALDSTPASVRTWLSSQLFDAASPGELRETLSPQVEFAFAGRTIEGIDAVIDHFATMPGLRLADAEWQVLPGASTSELTIRATGPGGTPLPSPGGPMAALDFAFTLDGQGLISGITPHPHHTEPADLAAPVSAGRQAPDFTLPDTSGIPVALREGHASATVVVFTCNACPWALSWHDRFQQVARDYAAADVRFLQINSNDPAISPKDAAANSRKRVADGTFSGPYLLDEGQQVARRWGARHTPDVFVLNAEGVVTYHGAADADAYDESLNAQWLRAALDHVLTGAPAVADTQPVGCTIKWSL